MRIAYGLVVILAACGSDSDMLPVGGGSGSGFPDSGTGGTVDGRLIDAKVIDGSPTAFDAAIFSGRVCLLTDARAFDTCASTGAAGLTVHLGGNSAVTAADGTFKIAAPTTNDVWYVTGSNIVSSYKVKNDYFIPAMTRTMFDALKAANTPGPPGGIVQGEGSVMVHVIRNGIGLSGATASSALPNDAKYLPFYDNNADQTDWNQTPSTTGTQGAVWLAGMDVGTTSFTITPAVGNAITEAAQPVFDQAITWDDVIFQ
ncbi:MAG TPA: hypothetical protein VL326_11935 [Kofleriaceae bacterium]|jgi:hypothetical protein|nr:hypothetical protein [Kofleriaceae bacterium]